MTGVFALSGALLSFAALPTSSSPEKGSSSDISRRMLGADEMIVVSTIAGRMAGMMSVIGDNHTRVLPQGVRDPDGRLGIIVVSSEPLVPPADAPWKVASKKWVMLAVMAAVKYTAGSPVPIDYIGFTDTQGMGGSSGRWFYELNLSTARLVQRQLLSHTITTEQAFEKVTASWRRVTADG